MRRAVVLLVAVILAGCTTSTEPSAASSGASPVASVSSTTAPPTPSPNLPPAPDHVIGVRDGSNGAELFDRRTGERFVVRGVNYTIRVPSEAGLENRVFVPGVWDADRFEADLAALAQRGYNTVRAWIDSCRVGPQCLAPLGEIGLNEAHLDNLAEAIGIAKSTGMLLLLTSNDIPDGGGYGDEANSGSGAAFAGYRNAHFLSAPGVAAATRYWRDIITGLRQRGAPTDAVLAWQLLNEMWVFEDQPPLSLRTGSVTAANGQAYAMASEEERRQLVTDGFAFWIERVGAAVRELDPTALVTVGFFHPKFPNPARAGDTWYVDTASLLARAAVDFFDFHAYPGVELGIEEYAENFGMTSYDDRPVIMGEVGAFTFAYDSADAALPAIARWMADSCSLGWDGWLYWEFYRPTAADDATWGFTDADNLLMDALAPANHPDACDADRIAPPNLALDRPVTVSAALDGQPGALAVDSQVDSTWVAGSHPPQWLEVALAAPTTVSEVVLTVSQDPSGPTRHRVIGRRSDGSTVLFAELAAETYDGQQLRVTAGGPWSGIVAIRVETLESLSWVAWREIEVHGE